MKFTQKRLAYIVGSMLAATSLTGCDIFDDDDSGLTCTAPQILNADQSACIDPGAEPVVAAANKAVVYLLDPTNKGAEADFSAYSMYRWKGQSGSLGDGVSCDALADSDVSSSWDDEKRIPDGQDDYGPYWIFDLADGQEAGCIHFIARQNIDGKIQAISGGDTRLNFADIKDRTATVIRNSTKVYDSRLDALAIVNKVEVVGAAAHWVDANTLLWNTSATTVSLYHSPTADFKLSDDGKISGATEVKLDKGQLSDATKAKFRHLKNLAAWQIADSANAKALLKEQLIAVAKDAEGNVISATVVQTPGVLDALYTSGDADADEATLGAVLSGSGVSFNLWAPTAQSVSVHLYDKDKKELAGSPVKLTENAATGIWSVDSDVDAGTFYKYELSVYHHQNQAIEKLMVTDPYSWGLSTNSLYSQVVDFSADDVTPSGWKTHTIPTADTVVIYESHIRDFSVQDESTSEVNRGKYLAFTEKDSVPMQHITELAQSGLTHFHLLPAFDIATVNEEASKRVDLDDTIADLCAQNSNAGLCSEADKSQVIADVLKACDPTTDCSAKIVRDLRAYDSFNWGYDPLHYGVPEGSYSSDPDGMARILEFRQMVKALHEAGLRVTMDVVYNHTNASGLAAKSVLDKVVPGYYHRRNADTGNVETSTCCENTATEHTMMAKLMKDTLVNWTREYKIDAFRFDLMGHQPLAAMEDSLKAVKAVDADNYFYGEGWNFGEVANDARFVQATQENLAGTGIGSFSDRMRDAVRGGRFNTADHRTAQGWASGLHTSPNQYAPAADATLTDLEERSDQIRVELAGGLRDFILVNYEGNTARGQDVLYGQSPSGYADSPEEIVSYISKHDNQTFWDFNQYKIAEGVSTEDRVRMHALGVSMPLLSQSVPFIHMGVEFLRSKSMSRDSYDSGDWYNRVDFTGTSNHWNVGLPIADEANWDKIKDILPDTEAEPTTAHITTATKLFNDFLGVRSSSPLFSLSAAEVKQRIDFRNVGKDHELHLIVMSLDDGTSAGADLDKNNDAIVLVFNGSSKSKEVTLGTGNWQLHPVLAASSEYTNLFSVSVSGNKATVPAFTPAVFVLPQSGAQGAGWAVNQDNKDLSQIPPFGNTKLYLRGSMNDWGTTDAMSFASSGRYTIITTLDKGEYEFKVADSSWGSVNYGAESGAIEVGKPTALKAGGGNLSLTLDSKAVVTFTADFSNKEKPTLLVSAKTVSSCALLENSAESGPIDATLAVRGAHSSWGWDADYALSYKGDKTYQVSLSGVDLSGGFKLASDSDNWDPQVIAFADGKIATQLALNIEYDAVARIGSSAIGDPGNNTMALGDGTYIMTLKVTDFVDAKTVGTISVCEQD